MSERKSTRVKTVAKALKRVDEDTRRQVAAARLDALENDNADAEAGGSDDSEYEIEEGEGVGKVLKRKKGKAVRTTRGAKQSKKGAKSFAGVLDEAMLDRVPPEVPTYASAAAAPPRAAAPRKFCSVCGFQSCYNCARCGMRFCSRKCNAVHTETRCLKFTA